MNDMPTKCLHGRNFCLECHGDHRHDDPDPKPRCPVFGCTIPRGIPHEHPAGTYMVMRDPVAPMGRHERAHIKALSDSIQHGTGFTLDGKYVPHSDVYVAPADAPMVPGRKLRDALLMAGHKAGDTLTLEESKPEPRRSFVRLVGSIAWRLVVVMLIVGVTVLVLAGVRP